MATPFNMTHGLCRQFAKEFNVLCESYEDHTQARIIIRVTDKRLPKPLQYSYAIDEMALRLAREPIDTYEKAFGELALQIGAKRREYGLDPETGAPNEVRRILVDDYGNWDRITDFDLTPKVPKIVAPEVKERKKLLNYGRY